MILFRRVWFPIRQLPMHSARDRIRHAPGWEMATTEARQQLEATKGITSTGNASFNVPASVLSVPALTRPVLSDDGMPLGLIDLRTTPV
jgi:hypothetical protein